MGDNRTFNAVAMMVHILVLIVLAISFGYVLGAA